MDNPVIQLEELSKSYGRKRVLKGVNLTIGKGQIIGLIGLNGAGKTTLLKTLLGLTSYRGSVSVLGKNPRFQRKQIMKRLCFISDVAILPRWLKVKNAVKFVAGVHPRFNREKAKQWLKKANIKPNQKVKHLSKGMVAQLHLILVMAIDAEILVLDEPTLGLDILSRKAFYRDLLDHYFTNEKSILVTTHQVEEVESILTDVIMIDEGEVALSISLSDYRNQFIEVIAPFENEERLRQFNPLSVHRQFGRIKCLFEQANKQALSQLGELSVPSVSDIFVAKMHRR